MFNKKNKTATRSRDNRGSDGPSLPDRSYVTPHNSHNLPPKPPSKPGYFSEQTEPQLPARSTSPYPGTWKPQRRDVPPPPPMSKPPQRISNSSFDDEYVVPGDLDQGNNEIFNQVTSHHLSQDPYWGQGHAHQMPKTPPLPPDFGDDEYAAPDELNHGHTNGYQYHQYQQQNQAPSTPPLEDDVYIAPDEANPSDDTYDAPEDMQMHFPYQPARNSVYPYQVQSPLTPPSSIDNQEIYDAPDENFPSPPPANSAYQYTEESYDVPENIDNGFGYGHGHARNSSSPPLPVTPPLSGSPFDDQDVYDTPDHDEFIPPAFSPPLPKANAKATLPAPSSPIKDLKANPVSELTKRFASMNKKPEHPAQPQNVSRKNPGKEIQNPLPVPKSPSKRPMVKQNTPAPKVKPAPVIVNKLEDQIWFKQNFKRNTSEDFLRNYNIDGGFIVRPSTKDGPGNYSFSIYYQGEIRHLRIRKKDNNTYSVGEEKENELEFDTVLKCVEYHSDEPLILKAGGEVCLYILQ